jgi:putative DNA modification/repair radical SAM protein
MELKSKLEILTAAAKYDVSCSSSGSSRKNTPGGLGNGAQGGICHSWSEDGRCVSLLKILLTNDCIYNCVYCVNRATNDFPRVTFTPEEIVDITINFYRRNYIEGLFLSSAVYKSPDHTMELMLQVVKKLRTECRFNGYIHLKGIPGTSPHLIQETGRYVDRMSINIELPSNESLKLLAPQKKKEAILKPMEFIKSQITANKEEKKLFRYSPHFIPAGQSTQMMVGATPDPDINILKLSEGMYKRFGLKRVFYSAYVPVSTHPGLPVNVKPPLLREHRLYQADWLLRFYGFKADELLNEAQPNFNMEFDPKSDWAIRNLHLFPIEVNRADFMLLLRIPGIGQQSAKRIVSARRIGSLGYEHLKKLGVVLKRARHFITCQGKYYGGATINESVIRQSISLIKPELRLALPEWTQLSLFSQLQEETTQDLYSTLTGEL